MKNYDGLFMSTYTAQLPLGEAIVRSGYDEGYDWIYHGVWERGYGKQAIVFLETWLGDNRPDAMRPMNKTELQEYIMSQDWKAPFPSDETLCLCRALYNGNPHSHDNELLSTGKLAEDIDEALWDGLCDGYRDAVHEAVAICGMALKECPE